MQNGDATFTEIFNAIDNAKEHIHIEYFIIKDSHIGRKFQQALIKKAREGLEIRLIYDAVGSIRLRKILLNHWKMRVCRLNVFSL